MTTKKPVMVTARIDTLDLEAGETILRILEAPVTKKNVAQLKVFIDELGEMFAEKYDLLLRDMTNKKLAMYACKCECGRQLVVDVTPGIFEGATEC